MAARSPTFSPPTDEAAFLTRPQLVGTLAGLMLAFFIATLDQTIVGTTMPKIIADLNGFTEYAWITTAYLLTISIAIPISGVLSDLFGRKPFLLAGVVIFVAGSAVWRATSRSSAWA